MKWDMTCPMRAINIVHLSMLGRETCMVEDRGRPLSLGPASLKRPGW